MIEKKFYSFVSLFSNIMNTKKSYSYGRVSLFKLSNFIYPLLVISFVLIITQGCSSSNKKSVNCTAPQVLQNGVCVTPLIIEGNFTFVWDTSFSSSLTVTVNQSISVLASVTNGSLASCSASSLPKGLTFKKLDKLENVCQLSGTFIEPKATTTYTFSGTSTSGEKASADLNITVKCLSDAIPVNGVCPKINGDGLLEITNIEQLNNIRWNTTSSVAWRTSFNDKGSTLGCPIPKGGVYGVCRGFKLANNIDFAGSKWSNNCNENCINGGWEPIGNINTPFTATFEGNGYTIRNLYINRNQDYVGLFGYVSGDVKISNVGLTNVVVRATSNGAISRVGGLVGWQQSGAIINSYVTGSVMGTISGKSGSFNEGGLVGVQHTGVIINSYFTGSVSGNNNNASYVAGGLVGWQQSGIITNSYTMGWVSASGIFNIIGGLVGQGKGIIKNSYTMNLVTVNGNGYVGGLVGDLDVGTIMKSYASGAVKVRGEISFVGGLVGYQQISIISNSYWDKMTTEQNDACGNYCNGSTGLNTQEMQATSESVIFPSGLGSCFELNVGKYPKLYVLDISLDSPACSKILLGGENAIR